MTKRTTIDIDKLIKEGGDTYQKLADLTGITRKLAKIILFNYFYGSRKAEKVTFRRKE